MHHKLIAGFIVGFCLLFTTSTAWAADYIEIKGMALDGKYNSKKVRSLQSCLNACKKCKMFEYDSLLKTCRYARGVADLTIVRTTIERRIGTKTIRKTIPKRDPSIAVHLKHRYPVRSIMKSYISGKSRKIGKNTDMPGNDIKSVKNVKNAKTCAIHCVASKRRCKAFTYVTANKSCWLKHTIGAKRPAPNMFTGTVSD